MMEIEPIEWPNQLKQVAEEKADKIIAEYFELTEEEYKNIPKKDMQAFLVDVMKRPLKHKHFRKYFKDECLKD